jgi:hypothetical protein
MSTAARYARYNPMRDPSLRQSDDASPEPTANRHGTDPDGTTAPHVTPVTLAAADRVRPTAQPFGHLPGINHPVVPVHKPIRHLRCAAQSRTRRHPHRLYTGVGSPSGLVSSATSLYSDVDRQRPAAQRHHRARDHHSDDIAHQPGTHAHRRPLLLPAESDCCYLTPNSRQEGN